MDIVLRASAMFVGLFLLLRLMGKRELAEMTPFELVLLVVMGDLIQQGVTQNDFSVTGALLAICTFAFWALVLTWITYLFPLMERWLDGEPEVIICNGRLDRRTMRRNRLTHAEVESELRRAGMMRIEDVAWGIVESNGKFSFIGHAPGQDEKRQQKDDGDAR